MPENAHLLIAYDAPDFAAPVAYIFELLLTTFEIECEIIPLSHLVLQPGRFDNTCVISYGREFAHIASRNQVHIYASHLFGPNYLKVDSMPATPLADYHGLPVIYLGGQSSEAFVNKAPGRVETNIDIVASSFFMISRYEEVLVTAKDQFGRFPASSSLAYREGFLHRPVVNEYIELLWDWLDGLNLGFKRRKPWGGKDFAVCLTHDMDEITRYRVIPPLLTIKHEIELGAARRAWLIWIDYLKTRVCGKVDPYHEAFNYIMDLETKHGFGSSFYFKTDNDRYSTGTPYLKEMVAKLQAGGFEVGIHPADNAFNKRDVLAAEKKKLEDITGNTVSGGRQHYLKSQLPASWLELEAAGWLYDATLGFADHEGFRCGICYPFRPFDIFDNRVVNIWEVPLTVMDGTLDSYRGLTPLQAGEIITDLLDTVNKYNGVFVLLWHNSYMCELFTPGWQRCFEDFYNIISTKNALVEPAEAIIRRWEK